MVVRGILAILGLLLLIAGLALLVVWATYSVPRTVVEEGREATVVEEATEGTVSPPASRGPSGQGSASGGGVSSSANLPPALSDPCKLQKVQLDKKEASIEQSLKMKVVLSPPSTDQGCYDTVTVQAPSYTTAVKNIEEAVEISPGKKAWKKLWILEPTTAGTHVIYVATLEDQKIIHLTVANFLGYYFPPGWIAVASFLSGCLGSALTATGAPWWVRLFVRLFYRR